MASEVSGGMMTHLFPSVGPTLMISMGYIDLAKWLAAIEGGARFGFDLVFLVLFFNCIAILCQYLATCIGMATEKDLAEICSEEYHRVPCILLGVQAELSMIISDITMILGIGHALSLLFENDLFVCIFYAMAGVVLLPSFLTFLDNCKAEALYIGVTGFTLFFYVFGVLISQPDVPFMASGIFPKLGESAYSVMALLGANVMAHNFYIHSSIVKKQKRQPNASMGALFHDHFFAILFIFTGIFLVNYVLMNSAAAVFGGADVAFNIQDVSMLMDQIFRTPIAPLAFFLVLFFSSQITALTRNIGGQVIFQCFFGTSLSWVHHALVKALAIIPALYYVKGAGAEGIYQLLIFCQVTLAMLLPSSVIPLFRVASSRSIMRSFKISWYLEILALVAFLVMFASNIFFVIEMLFGNNSWMINLMESTESTAMIPYTILLIIACASIGLTLHLAVTPLKSANDRSEAQIWTSSSQKDQPELSEVGEDTNIDMIKYDENKKSSVDAMEKSMEGHSGKSMFEYNHDLPEAIDSDHDSHHSAHSSSLTLACTSPKSQPGESKSLDEVESVDTPDNASTCLSDVGIYARIKSKDQGVKDEGPDLYTHIIRDNEGGPMEQEESFKGFPLSISDVPVSLNNVKAKGLESLDGSNGSGSLSKLSGLGRAARRQLASVLDEFWGSLFDFHGKLTQEAAANRLDVLLGLDLRAIGSTMKADTIEVEASKGYFSDADMGSVFPTNPRDFNSSNHTKNRSVDLPFGVQMGSSSWSQNMQSLNSNVQSSSNNVLGPSERLYSSLHLPQYSDSRDHQPATIHGYQIASYLREFGAMKSAYSSSTSPNLLPTLSSASSIPILKDQVLFTRPQNELGAFGASGLQNPPLSRVSRLQAEAPSFEPSFGEARENTVSSANPKKYHSSPDISAIIALGRNAYLNEAKRGAPIGPPPSSGRMISERSLYMNSVSRPGVPLAFDQLSPPKLHRDVFSLNPDTKSLWSRQPFEQFFGMEGKGQREGDGVSERCTAPPKGTFPYAESGAKLLQSLRFCIMKLLKLEGSDWLFRQNGGFDEELIDRIAASEKHSERISNGEFNQVFSAAFNQSPSDRKFSSFHRGEEAEVPYVQSVPNCGDCCAWRAALVITFGVWCIRRILELSLIESRPELWGKYTYVLNRLQGIIEPAFSKPRHRVSPCACLEASTDARSFNASLKNGLLSGKPLTNAGTVLEIIKDVEIAVSGRKGRTGTAAGDIAFPKGKENLASVLKRYKRRLQNKTNEGATSSRKIPSNASSSMS